ncbi:hypothetical protein [Bartonella apis]|uniref:hypothetical protein n=1 Tax=Bartonella apis TaxID=1686310 RepID=UPI0026E9D86E|nr:hypothetical protein [Bartonella apis]
MTNSSKNRPVRQEKPLCNVATRVQRGRFNTSKADRLVREAQLGKMVYFNIFKRFSLMEFLGMGLSLERSENNNHINYAIADTGSLVIWVCLEGDRDNQTFVALKEGNYDASSRFFTIISFNCRF